MRPRDKKRDWYFDDDFSYFGSTPKNVGNYSSGGGIFPYLIFGAIFLVLAIVSATLAVLVYSLFSLLLVGAVTYSTIFSHLEQFSYNLLTSVSEVTPITEHGFVTITSFLFAVIVFKFVLNSDTVFGVLLPRFYSLNTDDLYHRMLRLFGR